MTDKRLPGTKNARDLGGTAAGDGRRIKPRGVREYPGIQSTPSSPRFFSGASPAGEANK